VRNVHRLFHACNYCMCLILCDRPRVTPHFDFVSHPFVMRSLNQQLLAEKLNISRTTVSRSLANHPAISADTREKVQKMAMEMGYYSNPGRGARRSRQTKSATIGVLIGVPAENS